MTLSDLYRIYAMSVQTRKTSVMYRLTIWQRLRRTASKRHVCHGHSSVRLSVTLVHCIETAERIKLIECWWTCRVGRQHTGDCTDSTGRREALSGVLDKEDQRQSDLCCRPCDDRCSSVPGRGCRDNRVHCPACSRSTYRTSSHLDVDILDDHSHICRQVLITSTYDHNSFSFFFSSVQQLYGFFSPIVIVLQYIAILYVVYELTQVSEYVIS